MTDSFALELRNALEPLQDQLRVVAAEHIRTVVEQLTDAIESRIREAAASAVQDAASATERSVTERLTQEFARRERSLKEEAAREAADRERLHGDQTQATFDRLAQGIRALDEARSLSDALDALHGAASGQAGRVAVFLPTGDGLRMWRQSGFDKLSNAVSDAVAFAGSGMVADAIRTSTPHRCGPHEEGRPAFAEPFSAEAFVTVPVVMGGRSIAVLCAVPGVVPDGGPGQSTTTVFEILARHAARVLEALTASRLVQVVPQGSAPGGGR